METPKKIVLISFYDRICVSTRTLASVIKNEGHTPYLLYFKDDRLKIKDAITDDTKYLQLIMNNVFIGCGEDVNPPTDIEFKILIDKIIEIKPDVIGISSRIVSKKLAQKIVELLRSKLPKVLYIGGGYGPTVEPEDYLEFLDYVCIGEGEKVISDLLKIENPKTIEGLAWLEEGKLVYNKPPKFIDVEDALYPDWDFDKKYLIEDEKIRPIEEIYDTKTYDIFASRGCPSDCSYCMACHWGTMYKKYDSTMPRIRLRSVDSVLNELIHAKEKYDIKNVRFMDSIFGFNKKWLFEFLDAYDEKIGLRFFCHLDERFIDEDRIKRLKKSGITHTTVGIQSAVEEIRYNIMNRKTSDQGLIDYTNMLKDNGIQIKYDIIGWNPFENNETLKKGIEFLKRMPKGEQTVVYQLKIFPGSPLAMMFNKKKPTKLTNKEYEFWAWIYQMLLSSDETEKIADFALNYRYFRDNPSALKELFDEVMRKVESRTKIIAARDIKKGEIVTRVMVERKKTDEKRGVPYEEQETILYKPINRDIKKGELLLLEDFFGAYQNVGAGKF